MQHDNNTRQMVAWKLMVARLSEIEKQTSLASACAGNFTPCGYEHLVFF